MRLRIIAGRLRGRVLTLHGAAESFRPTLERHRESLAQIVGPRIVDSVAADLCAGSGVFGFELLSRGASRVDFVEADRGRARAIEEHAKLFGVEGECRTHAEDVRSFVRRNPGPYDIMYYDPPYADDALAAFVSGLFPLIAAGGILLFERPKERPTLAPEGSGVILAQTREYGIAAVDFYERRS